MKLLFPTVIHEIKVKKFKSRKKDLLKFVYEQREKDPQGVSFSNRGGWQSQPNYIQFNNILLNSSIFDQNLENKINQEILLTIWSVINDDLEKKLNENRTLIESRSMPSIYLLNTIKNSSNNNNFGEMILSIAISVEDKQWKEIHPEHLRIILLALSEANLEDVFRKIIFEILEESKII